MQETSEYTKGTMGDACITNDTCPNSKNNKRQLREARCILEDGEIHILGKTGPWPDIEEEEETSVWSIWREVFLKPLTELHIFVCLSIVPLFETRRIIPWRLYAPLK
jgi:hypothetical protein